MDGLRDKMDGWARKSEHTKNHGKKETLLISPGIPPGEEKVWGETEFESGLPSWLIFSSGLGTTVAMYGKGVFAQLGMNALSD